MLEQEGAFVAAHLQHTARGCAMAETGIKEARVMHAEFADHCQIGGHFGGIIWWNVNGFAADENVESTGIKDHAPIARRNRFPELGRVMLANAVKINDAGMGLCAPSRRLPVRWLKIHGKGQPPRDRGSAIDQRACAIEVLQFRIGQNRLPVAKPDLVQAHARACKDREGAWADLCIKRAGIARRDPVKLHTLIGDHARQ